MAGAATAIAAYGAAVRLTARRYGVPAEQIRARDGGLLYRPPPGLARARRAALYLAVVAADNSMRAVARAASLTPEGVRKALAAIEDLRDDPQVDAELAQMEREMQS